MAQFNFPEKTLTNPSAVKPDDVLKGVSINGPLNDDTRKVLSKDAAVFLALLHRSFNATRKALLERRQIRQAELDKGQLPDFLPRMYFGIVTGRYVHYSRQLSNSDADGISQRPSTSETTMRGRVLPLLPASSTGVSRSPGRLTARWSSTPSTPTSGPTWPISRV